MWKLLCLCLLLLLLCPGWTKIKGSRAECPRSASSCDECIQAGPECAWCTAPGTDSRCQTSEALQSAGCPTSHIYNPNRGVQIVRQSPIVSRGDIMALSIQRHPELDLPLRPGKTYSFLFHVMMPADQSVSELSVDVSPKLAGVNITFNKVSQGNAFVVEVTAEAEQCLRGGEDSNQMQNRTGPWFVSITPRGPSQSVKFTISLDCQCECTKTRQEDSPKCRGQGALVCGQCKCYGPYIGQQCEMNSELVPSSSENECRSSPGAPVCSGNGVCVNGECECRTRENPKERYSGMYCQCTNFDCPYWNGSICGGHGRCECSRCLCDEDWTDEDCSCSMDTDSCTALNQQICNGRGICECGICKCTPPFQGPTCEDCPFCPGACARHKECVECRAFKTGAKKQMCEQECSYLTVTMVPTRENLTQHLCRVRSHDGQCIMYYSFSEPTTRVSVTVAQAKECPPY